MHPGLDFDFGGIGSGGARAGKSKPGVEIFFQSLGGQLRASYRPVRFSSLRTDPIGQGYWYLTGLRRRRWVFND